MQSDLPVGLLVKSNHRVFTGKTMVHSGSAAAYVNYNQAMKGTVSGNLFPQCAAVFTSSFPVLNGFEPSRMYVLSWAICRSITWVCGMMLLFKIYIQFILHLLRILHSLGFVLHVFQVPCKKWLNVTHLCCISRFITLWLFALLSQSECNKCLNEWVGLSAWSAVSLDCRKEQRTKH